jgi:hypothetical protein
VRRVLGLVLEPVTRDSSVIRASSLSTCGLPMPPTSPGAVFGWSSMVFASSRTAWRWGSGIWLRVRVVVGVSQVFWATKSAPSCAAAVFASAIVDEQSCAMFMICLLDGVRTILMSGATPFIAVSAAVASAMAVVAVEHLGHFAVAGRWWLAGIVPVRDVGPWLRRLMVHESMRGQGMAGCWPLWSLRLLSLRSFRSLGLPRQWGRQCSLQCCRRICRVVFCGERRGL